jgi:FkbM family methyltransferase
VPAVFPRLKRWLSVVRIISNWYILFANRLLKLSSEGIVIYRLRSGERMAMQIGWIDFFVLQETFVDRVYEPTPDWRVADGWTVVDLGAHKGAFSVLASRTARDVRIVAVEPEPLNNACLRLNAKMNHVKEIEIHEVAMGPEPGVLQLRLAAPERSWGHSLVIDSGLHSEHAISVTVVTLDSILERAGDRIDLLKMDIEGSEYEVLCSISDQGWKSIQRVAVEFHEFPSLTIEEGRRVLEELFRERGFSCRTHRSVNVLYAEREGIGFVQ